jgi:hypothetical protein
MRLVSHQPLGATCTGTAHVWLRQPVLDLAAGASTADTTCNARGGAPDASFTRVLRACERACVRASERKMRVSCEGCTQTRALHMKR